MRRPQCPQGPGRAGLGWARGRGREGGGRRRRLRRSNRWDPAAWWRRAREEEEEEQRQREPEPEQEQDEPHKLTATAAARAQARSRSPRPGPLPASRLPWPPAGRPAPSAPPGPELPPSLLHPGRGEEEAEQEASRSRRRQRRRRRRPSRTERAAAPRVRPPPAPIQQPRRSHTAGQPGLRRAPAQPGPAQPSPSTGRPGGRPAPEGAGRGERMPKPTLLLRGGWERERSPGDSELGRQFRDWCLRTYGDSAKTKTVTRSKYQRIAEVLQGGGGTGAGSGPAAGEKGKFQFWVRSKGFRLGSGREPKMGQVVYVPVKTGSVSASAAAAGQSRGRARGGRGRGGGVDVCPNGVFLGLSVCLTHPGARVLLTNPPWPAWAALWVWGVPAPLCAAARAVAVTGRLSRAAHPSVFCPPVPSPSPPRQQAAAPEL